jgi:hypothetical protein
MRALTRLKTHAHTPVQTTKKMFKFKMTAIGVDLKMWATKVGRKNIDKARPYYDAKAAARKAHLEARKVAFHFLFVGFLQ